MRRAKLSVLKEILKRASEKNVICPLVTSYFEKIDFPEDTLKYLDNLYEQIKPNLQITQIK